jgi:hypothetical protein
MSPSRNLVCFIEVTQICSRSFIWCFSSTSLLVIDNDRPHARSDKIDESADPFSEPGECGPPSLGSIQGRKARLTDTVLRPLRSMIVAVSPRSLLMSSHASTIACMARSPALFRLEDRKTPGVFLAFSRYTVNFVAGTLFWHIEPAYRGRSERRASFVGASSKQTASTGQSSAGPRPA